MCRALEPAPFQSFHRPLPRTYNITDVRQRPSQATPTHVSPAAMSSKKRSRTEACSTEEEKSEKEEEDEEEEEEDEDSSDSSVESDLVSGQGWNK